MYTLGNPLRLKDPTGHKPVCDDTNDAACGPEMTLYEAWEAAGAVFGITFAGETWRVENMQAVVRAAYLIGNKYAGIGETASGAFNRVYSGVTMTQDSKCKDCRTKAQNDRCGNDFSGDCAAGGGVTTGSHSISFAVMSGQGTDFMDRMVKNVVHELGHVRNDNSGGKLVDDLGNTKISGMRDSILRPNPGGNFDWQQNENPGSGELFADMYIAWVYDAWNTEPFNAGDVDQATQWMYDNVP